MSCKIVITAHLKVDDKWFRPYQAYCYTSKEWLEIDPCTQCSIEAPRQKYYWHYIIEVDEVEYSIPAYACVFVGDSNVELPEEDQFDYWKNKYQDDTTDYVKEVKKLMGIDIRKAFIPQHEGDADAELMRKVKKHNEDSVET